MISGAVSKDFPLPHNEYIPTYQNPYEKKYSFKRSKINNTYTNEHPEVFRLDGMKEGGYHNPYLNQIIKVDRNEFFKKLSMDRKNINFIDFMKTERKYSQNPKLIRYISTDEEMELKRKRMGEKSKNYSYTKNDLNYNNCLLNDINKNNILKNNIRKEYNNLVKNLKQFAPKIDYRIKNTLKISDEEKNKNIKSNDNEIKNENIYKKISNRNVRTFNNLRNFNSYQINKTTGKDDEFIFERKQVSQFNPIMDDIKIISPPPYINDKWSPFLENYFLIANTRNKFHRKGGLLTEFCNKNIISINNDKDRKKEQMKMKIVKKTLHKNK